MPDITDKGLLILCAEGQRLYDEYCEIYDDESKSDAEMLVMWDAWKEWIEHKNGCDKCGYF